MKVLYLLGDLALLDPGRDPLEPGLDPFLEGGGDLDPARDPEPFFAVGEGERLLTPFLEAEGDGERSFLLIFRPPLGEPVLDSVLVLALFVFEAPFSDLLIADSEGATGDVVD